MYWRAPRSAPRSRLHRSVSARRVARVALHLASAFGIIRSNRKNGPEFRRRWSRQLLAILGIELEMRDLQVSPGTVLVANHVSWLDVVVLRARLPSNCAVDFVSKAEIRRWPLIGWLLEHSECLFIDRRVGRHLLLLNAQIGKRLARGRTIAFFPEGTTTDGTGLLPFRPALFEPAVRGAHPVQALALAYRDRRGEHCQAAAFIGRQNFLQSLLAIASQSGIVASINACPTIATAGLSRREAARRAQDAVQARLLGGSSLPARHDPAAIAVGAAGSASASGTAPSSTAPMWAN
jgi:1-acyl-sn-glycerol-3-phosphate acyltransferase